MTEGTRLRILVVDDNTIVRIGLLTALADVDLVASVRSTGDAGEAVALAGSGLIDVVLLDLRMPAVNGLDLLPLLLPVPVVMLTHVADARTVSAALSAGAAGYIVHGTLEPSAIVDAIRACLSGNTVVSRSLSGSTTGPDVPSTAARHALSPREVEVMDLVGDGLSNAEVAQRLFLSAKTVKNHLNRIFAKLDVTTRSQAIVLWIQGRGEPWV